MDFAALSAARYSLRKFSAQPVEPEKLNLILEAGRNAPTAHNNQPQRIFVLQSPEALEKADATTQMMLQAADLGLGTTYVGMFEPEKLLAAFPEMAGTFPIAMLPLGYPAEGAHPARLHNDRKPMDELVKTL